jgi:hypothetical protein
MSLNVLIYEECCLLTDINLNPKRIYHLLERRFKNNSTKTSFDFKCFLPEQPSNNAKVSRSLLRCQPKIIHVNHNEDTLSSDEASSSEEEERDEILPTNNNEGEDDRLEILSKWESDKYTPMIEDDEDDENENIFQSINAENDDEDDNAINPMDISSGIKLFYLQIFILMIYLFVVDETPMSPTEDLLVIYSYQLVKNEPVSDTEDDNAINPKDISSGTKLFYLQILILMIYPFVVDETPMSPAEDLLITYSYQLVKNEAASDTDDDVFDNPPQLDGHFDDLPPKSDPNTEKRLAATIAKVTANKSTPNKTIQIHIPPKPSKFRLNDDNKKKSTNESPKPSTSKVNQPKKDSKVKKKIQPRLLSSVIKTSGDVIRPLVTPIPTNTQVCIEFMKSKTFIFLL